MTQAGIQRFGARLVDTKIRGFVGRAWHVHLSHGLHYPIYGDGKVLGQTRHFVVADVQRLGGIGVPEHETLLYPVTVGCEQLSWGEETRFLSPGLRQGVQELILVLEAREKQRETKRKQAAEMRKAVAEGVTAKQEAAAKAKKLLTLFGALGMMLRDDEKAIEEARKKETRSLLEKAGIDRELPELSGEAKA